MKQNKFLEKFLYEIWKKQDFVKEAVDHVQVFHIPSSRSDPDDTYTVYIIHWVK